MILPGKVQYILHRLQSAGFSAYAVGGCVRDSLMGTVPKDWDICTSALPAQMKQVFREEHLVETGYFETVVPVLGHKETPKSAEQASVSMPAPEPTITQPSVLEGMNTDELRAYAQKQGISLRGVKTRKAIIKAIEDAEKRATEALKALRES